MLEESAVRLYQALAHDPLAELVQNWCAARCRRPDADQRFWRLETETAVEPTECEPPCRVRKTRAEPGRPNYAAVPGWFVAPADCTELVCEAAVGPVKILRLLVNQDRIGCFFGGISCVSLRLAALPKFA